MVVKSIQVTFEVPFEDDNVYDQEDRDRIERAILEAVESRMHPEPMTAQAIWATDDPDEPGVWETRYEYPAYLAVKEEAPMVTLNHMMMRVLKVRVLWDDDEA